jgi:hydrogenase-4 component F
MDFILRKEEEPYQKKSPLYHASLIGFVGAMDLAILSDNLGMVWVFIELSTLLSALLIAHHGSAHSLEATWKYVFICSVGIAFAFAGIVFLLIATGGELNMSILEFDKSKLFAVKIALPFLIIGFGTKAGLAPVHNWLPDAHSEAPTPVSALLSASLLNSAILPIVRVILLTEGTRLENFAAVILMTMGFLSITVAAVFISHAYNFKRMLAYSSVENMGILAIAFAVNCKTGFLLHMAGHSLIKCALFLTAGNILSLYGTKLVKDVKGMMRIHKPLAYIFMIGILAIMGFVPFVLFISEFMVVASLFAYSKFLCVLFIVLLTIIMYGLGKNMLSMERNEPNLNQSGYKFKFSAIAPIVILLTLSALIFFVVLYNGFADKNITELMGYFK